MADRKRCCCNCRRNIRTGNPGKVTCHCEIDGHYISYVASFEGWCRRWARETKWDQEKSERVLELYGKLKPYADAEEQGRLVILPCKVGDTIYAPTRSFVSEFRVIQFDFGGYKEPYLWVNWYLTKGITGNFRIDGISASEIGKTVFLTREEAEAALKGLKGETEDVRGTCKEDSGM